MGSQASPLVKDIVPERSINHSIKDFTHSIAWRIEHRGSRVGQVRAVGADLCVLNAQVEDLCHTQSITIPNGLDHYSCNVTRRNMAGIFITSCQSNQLLTTVLSHDTHLLPSRSQVPLLCLLTCV